MNYKFKLTVDTLIRGLDGKKVEYKAWEILECKTFEEYRNFYNYVRLWVLVEVKMKEKKESPQVNPDKNIVKVNKCIKQPK